jgi:DNA polymerase III subunit epsilon
MIREIILDTETTGISPAQGDRIVEIGALELINHMPTGESYHVYLNPERDMPKEAEAVHGLSSAFLKDKPLFAAIVDDFLAFTADATLVIHNASFDIGFLNAELSYVDKPPFDYGRVIDTLQMARRKHPMASNSLDALCKRYGIDNSKRTKHGALLDSELLAEVYLELIGGRQTALDLATLAPKTAAPGSKSEMRHAQQRNRVLEPRLTAEELAAHAAFVDSLGPQALWKK